MKKKKLIATYNSHNMVLSHLFFRLLKLLPLTGHFYTACPESQKKWMTKCFIPHGH